MILIKADKGNAAVPVVIQKGDYTQKVELYIAENRYQELKKDPIQKYQNWLKIVLKENNATFSVRAFEMNPVAPIFKGLVTTG